MSKSLREAEKCAAQKAVAAQDQSDIVQVASDFLEALTSLRDQYNKLNLDLSDIGEHPITKIFAMQIYHLAGDLGISAYRTALTEVEEIACENSRC